MSLLFTKLAQHHDNEHQDHQDHLDHHQVTPAGIKLDHHGVLERLADHHVHVQQREFPYSSVKLGFSFSHLGVSSFEEDLLDFKKGFYI